MSPSEELVERRRHEIARAASTAFATRGYQATGVADIAAELGIGHGTFYRYFENKRDILDYVIGDTLSRIGAALASEDPHEPDTLEEYRAQSRRIGAALFDVFIADPELAQLFFVEALAADRELTERVFDAHELMAATGAQYLQNGIEKGFLDPAIDPMTTSRAINGMIFACALALMRAPDPASLRDGWVEAIVRLIFDGVRPRRASVKPPNPDRGGADDER